MKVVINVQFGGFGLSNKAVMRYAELKGMELYPFISKTCWDVHRKVYGKNPELEEAMFVSYSTVPVVNGEDAPEGTYFTPTWDIQRDDPTLISVIGELKKKANGKHATLKVIKIPDGVEWEVEEYDGYEHIAEKHRTWS